MSTENREFARRSDLDALRASAMLLGIVLHTSLSFFPSYWMVADCRQNSVFGIVFSAIHGFRMPLFFVMCGFFSAMLLQKRGRRALVKHRYQRVFLPLLLGLVTVVPLTTGISILAMSSPPPKSDSPAPAPNKSHIWNAALAGDIDALKQHLANGTPVDSVNPEFGGTPLMWAATRGHAEAIEFLISRGANVDVPGKDGGTALIAAAFLGHDKVVDVLIRHGANLNAVNRDGSAPLDVATIGEGATRSYASTHQLEVNEDGLGDRKAAIAAVLRQHGAKTTQKTSITTILMYMPVFNHLWFLWFLWWLVVGYAALSAIASRLPLIRLPDSLVLSPARYLWLIPLTMIPQWYMGDGGTSTIFGPDTSTGILPIPHLFAYYAIFFGFGVIYYSHYDRSGHVGEPWWLPLGVGLLVILPLGLALTEGWNGFDRIGISPELRRLLTVAIQAAYPWLLTFGLMGLFRRLFRNGNPTVQYLSDSAYWLYLAHLPLIIGAQFLVRDWPIPAIAKFLLIVVVVTVFLLWTYQHGVRYTWLGRLLNGPRALPARAGTPAVVA